MHPDNESCQKITAIFAGKLNLSVTDMHMDLFENGVIDSLVFVNLLLALETEFGVTVSLDALELDNFRSIASIAEFVEQQRNPGRDCQAAEYRA